MRAPTCSSAPPCSKRFLAFLASSACAASATSYPSCSTASLPWPSGFSWAAPFFKAARSLLAFGSNFAVKRTASPPLTLAVRLLGGANLAAQRLAFTEQKMSTHRVYKSHEFMQPAEKEPIRSVVVESSHSVIVAWHVEPGQTIAPHIHPDGQDTWTILSGEGQYQIDEQGNTVAIVPGDIVVANKGQVHGVLCTSVGPLRFISVVAPLDAGYEPLSAKT